MSFDDGEPAHNVPGGKDPSDVLLVKIHRDARAESPRVIQKQVAAESQPPLQYAKPAETVGEIPEGVSEEVIEAVEAEVKAVRRVSVGIRRTVMRRDDDYFAA